MVLYHAPSSYYSMVARLALLEAGVDFDSKVMDIHLAKQQLTPWYRAINPHMTVPALVADKKTLIDSQDILRYAAVYAGANWCDAQPTHQDKIEQVVQSFYTISIENLTFGKAMTQYSALRFIFPRVIGKIVRTLKAQLDSCEDPDAVRQKIIINEQRIAYFTQGSLINKLDIERERVTNFLQSLPQPQSQALLFDDRISSADVVCGVLLGRLAMIGEDHLLEPLPEIKAWFARLQKRPAFAKADIWTTFKISRILLRR